LLKSAAPSARFDRGEGSAQRISPRIFDNPFVLSRCRLAARPTRRGSEQFGAFATFASIGHVGKNAKLLTVFRLVLAKCLEKRRVKCAGVSAAGKTFAVR